MSTGKNDSLILKQEIDYSPSRFLFFQHKFHKLNSSLIPLYLCDVKSDAVFIFFETEEGIISSHSVSFGGFDFSPNYASVAGFVNRVLNYLSDNYPNQQLQLTLAPNCYFKFNEAVINVLKTRGIEPSVTWINNYFEVEKTGELKSNWSHSDLKKIRKCERASFFARKFTLKEFDALYEVIKQGWASKGFELSLGKNALKELVTQFPDQYLMYGAFDGMDLISGAFVIRINPKILYVFYLGFLPQYSEYSPNRFLMNYIYKQAQQKRVKILDLGTSVNDGVREFKRRLGCKECDKVSFTIKL